MLVSPQSAVPRCTCTVDLLSKVMRPYLFRVVVDGQPPHAYRRVYTIAGPDEDAVAILGLETFMKEFGPKMPPGVVSAAPKARLA